MTEPARICESCPLYCARSEMGERESRRWMRRMLAFCARLRREGECGRGAS